MHHHPDNEEKAGNLPMLAMPGSGKFPRAAHSGRQAKHPAAVPFCGPMPQICGRKFETTFAR